MFIFFHVWYSVCKVEVHFVYLLLNFNGVKASVWLLLDTEYRKNIASCV